MAEVHHTALHPKLGPRSHTTAAGSAISPSRRISRLPEALSATTSSAYLDDVELALQRPAPHIFRSSCSSPGDSHVTWGGGACCLGEGNRKSLTEADKPAEHPGEALLGEVARAGLQGLSIKG